MEQILILLLYKKTKTHDNLCSLEIFMCVNVSSEYLRMSNFRSKKQGTKL